MAKSLMIQGTMSGVGKSLLVAGLCRVFRQDGLRVAPFKSQNMALNSFITREGLEIGRAQAVQAEACGLEPSYAMNPVLLKPTSDKGSQVIVNGEVYGNYTAEGYYAMKHALWPCVLDAYRKLDAEYDLIVVEGAGSPAEINLKADDFVNMGLAKRLGIPVLLAGDIDRGGVFAQLVGTLALLEPEECALVKATIVNKFRGDLKLLLPGLKQLEELTGRPVAGVVPWTPLDIDDEDSLSDRLGQRRAASPLDVAVIRLPRLSNFSDFSALDAADGVGVRYVENVRALGAPDLVILPGTKNTIGDMKWLRASGLEAAVKNLAASGAPVIGICGGYQMLGREIVDEEGVEGGGSIAGMGLLPVVTRFRPEKRRTRTTARALDVKGVFAALSGAELEGYEIHCGATTRGEGAGPLIRIEDGALDGCQSGNVYGCYLHGFFDSESCRRAVLGALAQRKGVTLEARPFDWKAHKERQYDALAQTLREHLDMRLIRRVVDRGA
ncbi:cobyric acid synthase [Pyramidobacter piscolens]|uniref:cobyric acid synthase n=1 Tax=Pyramidobacter piscolens TaxID=638849 RepID=UPI003AB783EF